MSHAIHPASLQLSIEQIDEVHARIQRAVQWACPRALRGHEDDLAQTTALRVFTQLSRGRVVNASYIKRAVHSVIIDEIRRRRGKPADPEDSNQLNWIADPKARPPDEHVQATELGQAIRRCLETLPASRRRAVTLHLLGHSLADKAQMLNLSSKSAENLVYRGLKALRSCLESAGLKP